LLDDYIADFFEMLPRGYRRCEAEPDSIIPVLDCQKETAEERAVKGFSKDGRSPLF